MGDDLNHSNDRFAVEYRRDHSGYAAGKFRPGVIEFFVTPEEGLPALKIIETRGWKQDFIVLLCDISGLFDIAPSGTNVTFSIRGNNIYFRFGTNQELRKFYDIIQNFRKCYGAISLATNCTAKLRRSPRNLTQDNKKVHNESGNAENGFLDIKDETINVKIRHSSNESKEDVRFGSENDNEVMPRGKLPINGKENHKDSHQCNGKLGGASSKSENWNIELPPDKENCHKTPVKNPVGRGDEGRTPLADKGLLFLDCLSPGSSRLCHSTPSSSFSRQGKSSIGIDHAISGNSKRDIDFGFSEYKTKRFKVNDIDNDVGWKQSPRSSLALSDSARLKGFSNIGNTCYMNSILQALFALDPFAKELTKNYQFYLASIPSTSLFNTLPLLLGVKDTDDQSLKIDLLRKVKDAISSTATRFSGNEQHDAHELLSQVLDQLKEEINKLTAEQVLANDPPPNPVQNNFGFSVCHYIKCQSCQEVSSKEEQFNDLSLDLPLVPRNTDSVLSLRLLLESFFKDENVSWKCEKCGGDSAIISHKFTKLPRILTLHLKRYLFDSALFADMKIATTIEFPRFLSLYRLCSENTANISLLSESTKKIDTSSLSKSDFSGCIIGDSGPTKARRQLDFGSSDSQLYEPLASQRYSFRKRDPYNTRSSNRIALTDAEEEAQLAEVLERSRHDTGPPKQGEEEPEFQQQIDEAIRLSLVDSQSTSEAELLATGLLPEIVKDEVDDGIISQENEEDSQMEPTFRLCGVVNHLGSGTGSGHYTADVLDLTTGNWRTYDDCRVKETIEDEVRTKRQRSAYIFFYMAKRSLSWKKYIMWYEAEYLTRTIGLDKPFFVRAINDSNGLTIFITDFEKLWTETLTPVEFENRLKELNPRLHAVVDALMNEIREMILGRGCECKTVVEWSPTRSLLVVFTAKYDVLQLHWRCTLRKCESTEFYKQIVRPLMLTISQYQQRESTLFELLTMKDQELEYGRMHSRKDKRASDTAKFRSEEWSSNDLRSQEFINAGKGLRLEKLSRSLVANGLFAAVCNLDVSESTMADTSPEKTEQVAPLSESDSTVSTVASVNEEAPSLNGQHSSTDGRMESRLSPSPPESPPVVKRKKKLRL